MIDNAWTDRVPAACTLPTPEQPLRRLEWDDLFAQEVLGVDQGSSGELRLELRADADVAVRAASLATRETACCSFFTFGLTITQARVSMSVSAEPGYTSVITALAARAQAKAGR